MWRGFGAENEPELPAQRGYFRPRISSISGVLAMTKQRLFAGKDDTSEPGGHSMVHPGQPVHGTAVVGHPVYPATTGVATSHHNTHQAIGGTHQHLLSDQFGVGSNGGLGAILGRCPSPARSSFGDIMSFSRTASARPSIDSQTAHAIYGVYDAMGHSFEYDHYAPLGHHYYLGDPLGIHDPSEVELGGVGTDPQGRFVKRSKKIIRGLFLMLIVSLCWVTFVHLLRMSFHTDRILLSISPASIFNSTILRFTRQFASNSSSTFANYESHPNSTINSNAQLQSSPLVRFRGNLSRMQQNEMPKSNFDAPYFVTWYCSLWNILYLPAYLMIHSCCLNRKTAPQSSASEPGSVGNSVVSGNAFGSSTSTNKNGSVKDSAISGQSDYSNSTSARKVFGESIQGLMDRGFTGMQFLSRCAFFSVLCLLANYMLIFCLRILDPTVTMALFATTASLIYLLSWVVLHQQFVGIRIVGIIVTDTGIALLVYMDGVQHRTLATVMIGFGAAIVLSVYKVFMRRMIGYTTFAQMALFHTIVGLMIAFLAWPLVLLLYVTGVETIVWSEIPWLYLTVSGTVAFLANIISSFGIICTYEFFLTLGLFFAIPISALIDVYINSVVFRDMKLSGIILILVGFVVVLLPDNWNQYLTGIFRRRLAMWKKREEMKKNGGRGQDTTTGQLSRLRTSSGRVK